MLHRLILATVLSAASLSAFAQNYPARPIQLIIPFAAGGPTDVVARRLAEAMGQNLGVTVVAENKTGAGGTIAADTVARAAPDGYTALIHHTGMSTAPALYKKLRFNPLTDFEYVGQVVDVPMTLVGRKDLPPNNYKELYAYLQANRGKVNLANAGMGAVSQLCGVLFLSRINMMDVTTIPYSGTGPAMTDLQGGQVDLLCDQATQTTQLIQSGRVKAYGATTKQRLAVLPDLPTLAEQGLDNFEMVVWHGIYLPKGTPKPVVDRLNAALLAGLADPKFKDAMAKLGAIIATPEKASTEGLRTHLKAEVEKWGPVMKAAGVNPE